MAIANPVYAVRCVGRGVIGADERELARLTDTTRADIERWLAEPVQGGVFRQHLDECRRRLGHREEIGWVIPTGLWERWDLRLGDARDLLPSLLDELRRIDVFVHDSLHTYEHTRFEYETACRHLCPGGYLVSDDVLWNDAFPEFVSSVPGVEHAVLRRVGFLKTSQEPERRSEEHDRA